MLRSVSSRVQLSYFLIAVMKSWVLCIHDLKHLYSHLVALVFAVGKDENKFPDSPCLFFSNGIWLDESVHLKPLFKHVVDSLYKAASHRFDFTNKVRVFLNHIVLISIISC